MPSSAQRHQSNIIITPLRTKVIPIVAFAFSVGVILKALPDQLLLRASGAAKASRIGVPGRAVAYIIRRTPKPRGPAKAPHAPLSLAVNALNRLRVVPAIRLIFWDHRSADSAVAPRALRHDHATAQATEFLAIGVVQASTRGRLLRELLDVRTCQSCPCEGEKVEELVVPIAEGQGKLGKAAQSSPKSLSVGWLSSDL